MPLVDGTGKIRAINQALMIDARLFGKLVEEVLLNLDGKEYARADSLKGKVTLLFVFIASSNAGCQMNIAGPAISIPLMNEFLKAFTLGEASPEDEITVSPVTPAFFEVLRRRGLGSPIPAHRLRS